MCPKWQVVQLVGGSSNPRHRICEKNIHTINWLIIKPWSAPTHPRTEFHFRFVLHVCGTKCKLPNSLSPNSSTVSSKTKVHLWRSEALIFSDFGGGKRLDSEICIVRCNGKTVVGLKVRFRLDPYPTGPSGIALTKQVGRCKESDGPYKLIQAHRARAARTVRQKKN